MKKLATLFILIALVSFCMAKGHEAKKEAKADDNTWHTSPHGLVYRIAKYGHQDTVKAVVGSQVLLHMHIFLKDSALFDSRMMNKNEPVPLQVAPPMFNGDIAEGLTYMTAGDSAIFLLPVDSLVKAQQKLPPFMHAGDTLIYRVAMTSVKSADLVKKEGEAKRKQDEINGKRQGAVDDSLLKAYFAKNNIKAAKTASGLYYKITKIGMGPEPRAGQTVSVNYTGKTMDGNIFDSNVEASSSHKEPLNFKIGQHQVIRGWDEGIGLLQKGSKATLYIPSPLAYGAQSQGPQIPANSILIFDVELLDIK